MSEGYECRQVVGIDLHRRRSVIVRMAGDGTLLETVQIVNTPESLAMVMTRAGEHPEVVLEAVMAGIGRPTCWQPVGRTCTWPTRWG